ncbi:hypothetical protein KXW34_008273, partial [Aspergillus fumigatus]
RGPTKARGGGRHPLSMYPWGNTPPHTLNVGTAETWRSSSGAFPAPEFETASDAPGRREHPLQGASCERETGFAVYNRTTLSPGAIGSGKVAKLKGQPVAATHA